MGDRQVLIAILLTMALVIGLAFSTRTPESTAGPQLLWRDPCKLGQCRPGRPSVRPPVQK